VRHPWQLYVIGPQAVGKMTVGQEVSRLTGAPVLYNHLVIDVLTHFFPFGSEPFERLLAETRQRIIEEAAAAGLDLIITGAWPFDDPSVLPLIEAAKATVETRGGEAAFVELRAPLEVRLQRNRSEHRRAHKNVDWATDEAMGALDREHRWYSDGDFPFPDRHLVIENTDLTPAEVARRIVEYFGLDGAAEG
jgi:hypothetical protein